ncbi:hypothetical protein FOL47_003564 [Perkinsus chesapeaki]|uniref:Uncharacterized protein n=1 Tax=Perkinsus chesapeaki TaxID=330153 RepID=A0A7J6M7U1_PERCH|nr:hypothetical protein FOL47_003564 [Perkinsus chesapeaki]
MPESAYELVRFGVSNGDETSLHMFEPQVIFFFILKCVSRVTQVETQKLTESVKQSYLLLQVTTLVDKRRTDGTRSSLHMRTKDNFVRAGSGEAASLSGPDDSQ